MFGDLPLSALENISLQVETLLLKHAALVDCSANDFLCLDLFTSQMPLEWRLYFQELSSTQDQGVLYELAQGKAPEDAPITLRDFLSECLKLSYHAQRRKGAAPFKPNNVASKTNKLPLGMGQKKVHETEAMLAFIQQEFNDVDLDLIVEAYLSRSLASLGFNCLGLEMSEHNIKMAQRLDSRTETKHIEYRQEEVTEASLLQTLASCPQKTLVVALHACGNLAVDCLRVFHGAARRGQSAVIVGCCYQWLDLDHLNLSGRFEKLHLSKHQLLCANQNPAYSNLEQSDLSVTKLFWRARLQQELLQHVSTVPGRVGRLRDSAYLSYAIYRQAALKKLKLPSSLLYELLANDPPLLEDERQRHFLFQAFWTLRCLLGPVIEASILLDRYIYLKSRLPEVVLRCLFDPASGSLRNMAFVLKGHARDDQQM